MNIWPKRRKKKQSDCDFTSSILTSLAACDLFLFPKLKMEITGRIFKVTMIQAKSWEALA
jgi:hypothetical protein